VVGRAVDQPVEERAGPGEVGVGAEVSLVDRPLQEGVQTRALFPARRLREWALFRAITLSLPWHPDALLESSDWLQRKTAAASNIDALAILAERGRTRRIRNTTRTNPKQPGSR
jgi:hypothetical protein